MKKENYSGANTPNLKLKMNKMLLMMMAVLLVFISCSKGKGEGDKKGASEPKTVKTVNVGQGYVASGLDPGDGGTGWALTSHGISENLYFVNKKGELDTRLVESISQKNDNEWEVKLKKDILFSDGTKVDAKAVSDALNRTNEKNAIARGTAGALKFSPIDEFTVNIKSEKPTKIMKAVLAEWTNVIYKVNDKGEFIFTGPFAVESLTPNTEVKLAPNKYFPDAEKRPNVTVKEFKDPNALKLAFENNELDIAVSIPSEFAESLQKSGHTLKPMEVGYQYFAFVNLTNKVLSNAKVREALDLAINRDEMIASLHGGKKPTGFFAGYFPFTGKADISSDVNKAASLLDEAGWKLNTQGIREKDGKPLSLTLVTYPQRPDLVTLMQVMSSQLKKMGIDTKTEISENIGEVGASKKFDIMLYAQHTASTGVPTFSLNQFFRPKASNNYTGYSSKEFEDVMKKLDATGDQQEMIKLAVEAQDILKKDRPVLFLVDPVWYVGLSDKVKDYEVWGADYYIVRADLTVK